MAFAANENSAWQVARFERLAPRSPHRILLPTGDAQAHSVAKWFVGGLKPRMIPLGL